MRNILRRMKKLYLDRAIELAKQHHEGQTDKAGKPYIEHPLRVMNQVESEEEKIVAVLHDIVEDTDISLDDLRNSLRASNTASDAVSLVENNTEVQVIAGTFLSNEEQIGDLVVGVSNGKPVFLRDVSSIEQTADSPETYVSFGTTKGAGHIGLKSGIISPAVTIAIAKQPGVNAVSVSDNVIKRIEQLKGTFIPEGVNVTVTRNYGATAKAKSDKLIHKLIIETIAVALL